MFKTGYFLRTTLWSLLGLGALFVLFGTAAFLYLSPNLPSVDALRDVQLKTPLRVYTSDGKLIGEYGEMRRTPIKLSEVPPLFIKAVLAAEDSDFYHHHGIDIESLMRAAAQLVISGHIQTGGSTITMQVAKNYFLTQQRTFSRKFNEILLALQIDHNLSKDEILQLYLNKIFLGNRAYGVEAAARVYYGKSIKDLSLAQWAMIAGLPKAPSANNPIANPKRAVQRRNWILGRMYHLGDIDQQQYETALHAPVDASYHGAVLDVDAGYAAEMVRREMVQRFGDKAYTDGYVAYTTLDGKLQQAADDAVVDGLVAYDQRHGYYGPRRHFAPSSAGTDDKDWRNRLAAIPEVGGMVPAIVTQVDKHAFTALLASGDTVTIDWQHGLSTARKFIDANHRGPAPQTASDVVSVGDLVRLRKDTQNAWELTEIPHLQAALVSLNADNGAILSLVGGFDFHTSEFNRVTQAERQPGSGFKPFIYTAALAHGLTPATMINDAPIVFQDQQLEDAWRPENDTGKFYGPTSLRQALYESSNVVSVRLLQLIGVDTAINFVPRFGFDKKDIPHNLSIALGSLSVTPLQMARGYAVFANTGYLIKPYLLQRVEDHGGNVVYQAEPPIACPNCAQNPSPAANTTTTDAASNPNATASGANASPPSTATATVPASNASPTNTSPTNATPPGSTAATGNPGTANAAPAVPGPLAPRVLDKRYAFIMNSMLRDVIRRGTGHAAASMDRSDMAGKTGTSSGPVDAWFNGYSGGIVTTVWTGFDQYQKMGRHEFGATVALPIWMQFMRTALAGRPEQSFKQPEGVVSLRIDPHTGLRAPPDDPNAVFEYFTQDNIPARETSTSGQGNGTGGNSGVSEHDLF